MIFANNLFFTNTTWLTWRQENSWNYFYSFFLHQFDIKLVNISFLFVIENHFSFIPGWLWYKKYYCNMQMNKLLLMGGYNIYPFVKWICSAIILCWHVSSVFASKAFSLLKILIAFDMLCFIYNQTLAVVPLASSFVFEGVSRTEK